MIDNISQEDLAQKIESYFTACDSNKKKRYDDKGNEYEAIVQLPYTLAGLAAHIGVTREYIKDVAEGSAHYDLFQKAKARILANLSERACNKYLHTPGLIFMLKNDFDMVDKTDVKHSGFILTDEQRKRINDRRKLRHKTR